MGVLYDIFFDLIFYVQHRLYHTIPWLYRICHKDHHTLTNPQKTGEEPLLKSWHTTNMSLMEVLLVLTGHVPVSAFLAICIFGSHPLLRMTGLDIALILGYMICHEHLGHVDSALDDTLALPS